MIRLIRLKLCVSKRAAGDFFVTMTERAGAKRRSTSDEREAESTEQTTQAIIDNNSNNNRRMKRRSCYSSIDLTGEVAS